MLVQAVAVTGHSLEWIVNLKDFETGFWEHKVIGWVVSGEVRRHAL
jgi:hypothetical protein